MTKKDKAADLRLQRLYGLTLKEYEDMLAEQGGRCAICRRPPKKVRLAVDHNHAIERTQITVSRKKEKWVALAAVSGVGYGVISTTRPDAVIGLRKILKRRSVRGILCFVCNRKVLGPLERFKVRPAAVIDYLKKFDPDNPILGE